MDERLAEIEARVNAATDGPWRVRGRDERHGPPHVVAGTPSALRATVADYKTNVADYTFQTDAEFIAHAREDIPWLLAQLASVREALADAEIAIAAAHRIVCDAAALAARSQDGDAD